LGSHVFLPSVRLTFEVAGCYSAVGILGTRPFTNR
jgi:hypothetical protein